MTITTPRKHSRWGLTQAARALNQPQHRLIYLCDRRVVRPDFEQADGRGSSRGFSKRNLLEFAVALRLRDLQLPVSVLMAIVYVLRGFQERVKKESRVFSMPESLWPVGAPDLRIVISDGRSLHVSLGTGLGSPRIFGPIDLQTLRDDESALEDLERGFPLDEWSPGDGVDSRDSRSFGGPEGSQHWRVEISVTRLAQDLPEVVKTGRW